MSARFIGGKVLGSLATLLFVVCFNFFLFRVVETDPVANLYRGHNLTQTQRAKLTEEFGLDKSTGAQFVAYLKQTATLNLGRSYTTNQPVWEEIKDAAGPTIALVGISAVLSGSSGSCSASPRRGEDGPRPTTSRRSRWPPTRCPSSGSG